jgi:hypothetical protein
MFFLAIVTSFELGYYKPSHSQHFSPVLHRCPVPLHRCPVRLPAIVGSKIFNFGLNEINEIQYKVSYDALWMAILRPTGWSRDGHSDGI